MTSLVFPDVNALLNAIAAVLLVTGHRMIKRGKLQAHRKCMIGTFGVSCLFLLSYVTYHALHGSQPFWGTGWLRTAYLVVLGTHVVCAAAVVPMALITLRRGLKRQDALHRSIARWTYPIWLYVSVTGVLVYLVLYQLRPGGPGSV